MYWPPIPRAYWLAGMELPSITGVSSGYAAIVIQEEAVPEH